MILCPSLRLPALAVVIACLCGPGEARLKKEHSFTASPRHLLVPKLEGMAEYASTDEFGGAFIMGFGLPTFANEEGDQVVVPEVELGAQLLWYPIGYFWNGVQVGGEVRLSKYFVPKRDGIEQSTNSFATGPIAGYKWCALSGFTVVAQGGYSWETIHSSVRSDEGGWGKMDETTGGWIVNFGLGWSI